jgi:hypothetical protein
MKKIIAILTILFLVNSVYAQDVTNQTTTTTPYSIVLPPAASSLKGVYDFLVSINPIILIVLGIVLILASHLGKFVGIVLIIIALIHLFFLFFH